MSVTLVVPGTPAATVPFAPAVRGAASGAADPGPATDLLAAVRVTHAFSLSPVARAQGREAPESIQVEDDSILEIELEGGLTLWTSVARYRAHLAVLKPEAVQADRVLFDVLPEPSASERGVKDWVANALRVLRLEADDLSLDLAARVAGKAGAWAATKLLVKRIESRLTPGPGLYRWADASTGQPQALSAPMVAGELEEGQDVLLFIHGTASSTLGSFGALTAPESHATWTALADHFERRVFALEHHTLSESPVENALQVAQALPRGTRLHLVSHSRGGLVGDLLCLRDLKDEEIARWRRDAGSAQADEADRRSLTVLRDLLGQKQIEVVRFARVACPARGTLLASENIDEFLSILTNLIGMIPGFATSVVYDVIKRITLETVKNRWDPDMIPGIEAMIPSSPLVALLNGAGMPARGDLGVIAGDIEGGNWLKRLGVFVSDRFIYASRDNDLVVNTDSMFEGAPRSGGGHYVFDQGADVSHFNYFHNPRTRRALQQWLARAPSSPVPPAFRPIADEVQAPIPMPRAMRDRSDPALPVVVIVPTLFGSRLCAGQQEVWPSYSSLTHGGLARLVDGRATDGRGLKPTELVPDHYGRLGAALSDRHEVVPFAYDWRRSIREAAKALADEMTRALARTEGAVRIVAHGSGGLVVRQMIHEHAEIWTRMGQRSGARVILIGTPNRGTYETVETLLGVGTTIRQLQLLDPALGSQRLLDGFARWPGMLELLPSGGGLDFFDRDTWRDVQRTYRHRVAVPEAGALRQAREFRAQLPERIPDAERVLYLAGTAPVTPSGLEIVDGRAVLLGTPRGDGRVTYESGLLPDVATWYMPVEHGALLDPEALLPTLVELLDRGATARLSRAAPAGERGGAATFRYFPEGVLYPTEADLIRGLMGRRAPSRGRRARAALRVSVVHGDLRYASYPLLLGHYEGDTIAGAEAHLDRRLEGALSHRYQLGLYPGELGTTAVVLDPAADASPPGDAAGGAIVVGLGKMGDLNPNTLAEAVRRGALNYVMQAAQTHDGQGGRDDGRAPNPRLGLSALLIGVTTATSIGVEDSVGAILRGVTRANLEISQVLGGDLRITDLEIIELFADAAIEACRSAIGLVPSLDRELGVTIEAASRLRTARGRQERLRQTRYRDYWRRVEITLIQDGDEEVARRLVQREVIEQLISSVSQNLKDRPDQAKPLLDFLALPWRRGGAEGRLRFLALSDRARAEVMMQPRQLEVIDRLVATSVRDTQFKVDTANTLFELLLPNELKDTLSQQSWLVLVVDADTASYPWELMVDRQEPLSGKVGMVRQLATGTYRQQIRASTTNWAFVVGEPLTAPGIPPLPQARAEASMVAGLLRQNGYDVTHSEERPTALDVLNQLFARPYRILHLAGHGHYRAPRPGESEGRSGMVLQDGLFLTAVEIGQMRQVPDLVFLNCCHIGQVGSEVAFNKLAASVSRELIQMGVRAVVAAGWAVRDDAAREFARIFYERMLAGEAFGRALLDARRETYNAHPDCNTWGAYQAYGDPDFKLRPGAGPTAAEETLSFVAPEEVVNELNSITERTAIEAERVRTTRASAPGWHAGRAPKPGAKTGGGRATRLERLRADCPPDWLVRGDVLAALAEAYGELGDFEQATEHYRRALAAPSGTEGVSLRQVEQFANLEARWGEQTGRRDLIESAIGRIERLLQFGETSERLALLGSARKRFAQTLSDPHEIRRELVASRDYYQKAVQAGQRRGTINHYWILNWVAGAAMLGQHVPDADAWLARVEAGGADRLAVSRSYWDAVGQADVALVRALLDATLATPRTTEALLERYEAALRSSPPSPRELDSTLNQLRAMAGLLEALGGDAASTANAKALRALWTKLGGHHVSAADGHADEPARAEASEPRAQAAAPAALEEHGGASTASGNSAPVRRKRAARRRPRPQP